MKIKNVWVVVVGLALASGSVRAEEACVSAYRGSNSMFYKILAQDESTRNDGIGAAVIGLAAYTACVALKRQYLACAPLFGVVAVVGTGAAAFSEINMNEIEDARRIFQLYLEANAGTADSIEAKALFESLKTPAEARAGVLQTVKSLMESGQLCGADTKPATSWDTLIAKLKIPRPQ